MFGNDVRNNVGSPYGREEIFDKLFEKMYDSNKLLFYNNIGVTFTTKAVKAVWDFVVGNSVEIEGDLYFCASQQVMSEQLVYSKASVYKAVGFLKYTGCIEHTGCFIDRTVIWKLDKSKWLGD